MEWVGFSLPSVPFIASSAAAGCARLGGDGAPKYCTVRNDGGWLLSHLPWTDIEIISIRLLLKPVSAENKCGVGKVETEISSINNLSERPESGTATRNG